MIARSLLVLSAFLGAMPCLARAEVYQCIDATGKVLLTDRGCPQGYRTNLVVREPEPAEPPAAAQAPRKPDAIALAERRRLDAEAEAARLLDALEAERQQAELTREQMAAIAYKLDALADRPVMYDGPAVVYTWPWIKPRLPHGGHGPPHGQPHKPHKADDHACATCPQPRRHFKPQEVVREERRDCGTFGCTPTITHAPWDVNRWDGRSRAERRSMR